MATDYSKKAFEMSNQIDKKSASEFNRVIYATAKAHKQLKNQNLSVEINSKDTLKQLILSKTDLISYIFPQEK
jgi:hypothetical protein